MDNFNEIEMIAKNMNIIINMYSKEINDNPYSKEAMNVINSLINTLVKLSEGMNQIFLKYPSNKLSEDIEEIANYFEKLIDCYETKESFLIKDIFVNKLVSKFGVFYKNLSEYFFNITGIKKAIVIGINNISNKIEKLLNNEKCRIISFVSEDANLKGKWLNNIPIHGIEEIKWINYDYIINSDYSVCDLEEKESINIDSFINKYYDYEIYRAYDYYINCKKPLEAFITGISYHEVAIDTKQLPNNIINLAVSSQDLFYDYEWAKMVLNNQEISKNIKYAIIGLSYYSFEYDLSKSNFKDRVCMYYPIFKKCHSHYSSSEIIKNYNEFNQVAPKVLKKDYSDFLFSTFRENSDSLWEKFISGIMDEEEIKKDSWMVEKDCNKNYPITVQENIKILKEYIQLLKTKGIKPIVVVCPTSEHYYSRFSPRIKSEFIDIINKVKDEFNIEVLDYFESKDFTDNDFYNVSHLNKEGAKKFTKMLREDISF